MRGIRRRYSARINSLDKGDIKIERWTRPHRNAIARIKGYKQPHGGDPFFPKVELVNLDGAGPCFPITTGSADISLSGYLVDLN